MNGPSSISSPSHSPVVTPADPATISGGSSGSRTVKTTDPTSHLSGLAPDHTPGKSFDDRSVASVDSSTSSTPSTSTSSSSEPEATTTEAPENFEGLSTEELEEKQSEKLEKAAEVSDRYEQFSLMGRAKSAIIDPLNAPKDLRVTVALPGQDPVTIIPWSDEVAARTDIAELRDIAVKVLDEYEEANFKNYDAQKDYQSLETLKSSVRVIADKLGDNKHEEGVRGGFQNSWEKRWNEVRFKPVRIEAFDGHNPTNKARVNVEKRPVVPQDSIQPLDDTASETSDSEESTTSSTSSSSTDTGSVTGSPGTTNSGAADNS